MPVLRSESSCANNDGEHSTMYIYVCFISNNHSKKLVENYCNEYFNAIVFSGVDMCDFLWLFLSPNRCFNLSAVEYMERLLLFLDWAEG